MFLSAFPNYGKNAKSIHLAVSHRINDEMREEHTIDFMGSQTTEMTDGTARLTRSETLEMVRRLGSSLVNRPRYLIPCLDFYLKLLSNSSEFCFAKDKSDC